MNKRKLLAPLSASTILLVQILISGCCVSALDSKFRALVNYIYLLRHYSKA